MLENGTATPERLGRAGQASLSRAALVSTVALAALTVCDARAPVRAGNTAVVINSTPSGSTYTNSGVINGTTNGVVINATVNTVTNTSTGTITGGGGSGNAIGINANVGTLTNSGTLSSPIPISNWFGYIGTFKNSGKMLGAGTGFQNISGVGTLTNTGTISGGTYWGIWNVWYGPGFGSISNAGTITGAASGLINTNSIGNLTNSGVIQNTGYSSSSGVWGVTSAIWNYGWALNGTIGTLTNSGTITGPQYGIVNYGATYRELKETYVYTASISTISNSGTIYGGKYAIYNGTLGTIGTLTNSGKILANQAGIYNTSTFGNISNSATGTISGGQGPYGIFNSASMGALTNSGTISSQGYAIYNSGSMGALTNQSGATITGGNGTYGVYNKGTMGAVTNGGLITAAATGFYNSGSLGALSNTGTISSLYNAGGRISGGATGVANSNQFATLTNTGSISGTTYGVNNIGAGASIASLANLSGGKISGSNTGIFNTGSIGTLSNSGVISGSINAINSMFVLTNIVNAGTIAGNISIFPATSAPYQSYITITGATTNAMGTLSGGTISTGLGNLTMVQNTLLEDNVYLPGTSSSGVGKLVNYGQLSLLTNQTIYGNFKNNGTLVLGTSATLTVTGGEWVDPPASSTGTVLVQASEGDASPLGMRVIGQTNVPVDASLATVDGIGYSVSNIRNIAGPGGTYLLVADVARTNFDFRQDGNLVVSRLDGTRALTQSGSGSTYLIGANGYTGPTTVTAGVLGILGSAQSPRYTVTGGTLRIDGVATGQVSVSSGGTLEGSGAFGGGTIGAGGVIAPSNVAAVAALAAASDGRAVEAALGARTAYGTAAVSLGNASGNLLSNRNLTLAAGSTYRVGVTPSGLSDHLIVNGQAALQGGAVEVRAMPGAWGARTAYTILTASGGVSGSFGAVSSDLAFLTPTLSYDPNDVYLTLRRNDMPFTAVAATQNQYAVASGLQGSYTQGLSVTGGAVIDALTSSSVPQARAMLQQISGEGIAAAQTTSFGAMDLVAGAVRGQAMDWVMGTLTPPWGAAEPAAPATGRRWRSWATALGGGERLDGVGSVGSASVSVTGGGGAAGLEVDLDNTMVLGVAAGGVTSSYSVSGRSTSGQQSGGIGALYGVGHWDAFYAMGLLSYGGFGTDTTRWLNGPAGVEQAKGTLSSNAWSGRAEIGYRFATPLAAVTPYLALQGTSLQSAGLTESSTTASGQSGDLALRVQGGGASSVPGSLGVQFDRSFAIDADWVVRPVMRLAWTHEFSTNRAVTAGLTALPASLWTVQGASAAANTADVRLAVQALHRNGWVLSAGAAAYAAPRATGYQGQVRVSYTW